MSDDSSQFDLVYLKLHRSWWLHVLCTRLVLISTPVSEHLNVLYVIDQNAISYYLSQNLLYYSHNFQVIFMSYYNNLIEVTWTLILDGFRQAPVGHTAKVPGSSHQLCRILHAFSSKEGLMPLYMELHADW